jgi:hypothetical protein
MTDELTTPAYADFGRASELVARVRRRVAEMTSDLPAEPQDLLDLAYGMRLSPGELFIDRRDGRRVGVVASWEWSWGSDAARGYAVVRPHAGLALEGVVWARSPQVASFFRDGREIGRLVAEKDALNLCSNRWELVRADGSVIGTLRTPWSVGARRPLELVGSGGPPVPVYLASVTHICEVLARLFALVTFRWRRLTARTDPDDARLIPAAVVELLPADDRDLYLAASAFFRVCIANFD